MSSAGTAKKYKLASSTVGEDGKPRLCAFFLTESGCRMGANCKFSHETSDNTIPSHGVTKKNQPGSSTVSFTAIKHELVSSESENENDRHVPIAQKKNITIQNQQQDQNQQQQYSPNGSVIDNEEIKAEDTEASTKKKKKKKRKNKSTDEVAVPTLKAEVDSSSPFVDPNTRSSNKKFKPTPAVPTTAPATTIAPAISSYSDLAINAPVPNFPKLSDAIRDGYNTGKFIVHKNRSVEPAKPTVKPSVIQNNQQSSNILSPSVPANFRSLNLPITSFSVPAEAPTPKNTKTPANTPTTKPVDSNPLATNVSAPKTDDGNSSRTVKINNLVVPQNKIVGQKWVEMVKLTQEHAKFKLNYDMEQYMIQDEESGSSTSRRDWISFKPYGEWSSKNPQIISIDCEMCETTDPVSNSVEEMALSRISIIDVATDEVLLDTLVKPSWPVTDYRTNITGITAEHLQTVQFTLRHAQAFLLSLCSDQTIIIGHALHHDLATLKIRDHSCVVDSAILYQTVRNSERATVSLKDLASHVLKIQMPLVHDSVNDARVAMQCIVHYMNNIGKNLDTRIPRMFNGDTTASKVADEQQPTTGTLDFRSRRLLIHHIPKNSCNESDVIKMFTLFTDIKPKEVEEIDFPPLNTKTGYSYGKTTITFRSAAHANLAFDTLLNRVEYCPSNRKQKRINLKNGHYIWVRKMIWENEIALLANLEANETEQQQNQ